MKIGIMFVKITTFMAMMLVVLFTAVIIYCLCMITAQARELPNWSVDQTCAYIPSQSMTYDYCREKELDSAMRVLYLWDDASDYTKDYCVKLRSNSNKPGPQAFTGLANCLASWHTWDVHNRRVGLTGYAPPWAPKLPD